MLHRFYTLKLQYASTEIIFDDLKSIQSSCDISFENRGIARSNLDCLLCTIVYNPLKSLQSVLKQERFDSIEVFASLMRPVIEGSDVEVDEDDESISYESELIDIVATKEADGSVRVKQDDVNIQASFDVYLRVQHMQ